MGLGLCGWDARGESLPKELPPPQACHDDLETGTFGRSLSCRWVSPPQPAQISTWLNHRIHRELPPWESGQWGDGGPAHPKKKYAKEAWPGEGNQGLRRDSLKGHRDLWSGITQYQRWSTGTLKSTFQESTVRMLQESYRPLETEKDLEKISQGLLICLLNFFNVIELYIFMEVKRIIDINVWTKSLTWSRTWLKQIQVFVLYSIHTLYCTLANGIAKHCHCILLYTSILFVVFFFVHYAVLL